MKVVVEIPQSEMIEAISNGIIAALSNDSREPYQVISDAIRDGVAKAISESLGPDWGGQLANEIAARVAASTRP